MGVNFNHNNSMFWALFVFILGPFSPFNAYAASTEAVKHRTTLSIGLVKSSLDVARIILLYLLGLTECQELNPQILVGEL